MKYLYLIERRNPTNDYDVYESAVVCAEAPLLARNLHPDGRPLKSQRNWQTWPPPEGVSATNIGLAHDRINLGDIVHSSFYRG